MMNKLSVILVICCVFLLLLGVCSCKPRDQVISLPFSPSGQMHVFNGTKEQAYSAANKTTVPITENPRNVLGTSENLPVYSAKLSDPNIAPTGIVIVSGSYYIECTDWGGGMPMATIAVTKSGKVISEVRIETEKINRNWRPFKAEIEYNKIGQADAVELRVATAGSWGFYLNEMTFAVPKAK